MIYNLAKQLADSGQYELYIIINSDSQQEDFKKLDLKIIPNKCPADSGLKNHLFTLFYLPFILLKYHIDLVIYPQICIFSWNPCKSILYMHDLIEYHLDNQSKSKLLFRKIAYPYVTKHSTKIVSVSESTKRDLTKFLNVPGEKIEVAYNGYDADLHPIDKEEARKRVFEKYGIKDYIYYIGYLTHPQKNLFYLIDEFEKISKEFPNLQLVFAGPKGVDADQILNHVNDRKLADKFKYLGKVPYSDLKYLYSAAQVFCFPSIFEGFGMPVLEAMACSTPVITSNVSSMPELLPNKEYLIDPHKEGDLSNILKRILCSDMDLIGKDNLQYSKKFSWKNHGEKVINLINSLI